MIKVFAIGLFMIMLFYPIAHLLWTFVFVRLERDECYEKLMVLLNRHEEE